MRANAFVWLILVGLTLVAFGLGDWTGWRHGPFLILALAGIKGGLLGWRYMELRVAHLAWRVAFGLALVVGVEVLLVLS